MNWNGWRRLLNKLRKSNEITKEETQIILAWLLEVTHDNPDCPYTPKEARLALKLIKYSADAIGYPTIEKHMRKFGLPNSKWMPQGRILD